MNATVATLADEAARLLPEPPAGHDAFGYLAWEELVVDTARRLALFSGGLGDLEPASDVLTLTPHTRRLDGRGLLSLATIVNDDPCAGERALWLAVTNSDLGDCAEPTTTSVVRLDRSGTAHGPANRRGNRRRRTLLTVVKN